MKKLLPKLLSDKELIALFADNSCIYEMRYTQKNYSLSLSRCETPDDNVFAVGFTADNDSESPSYDDGEYDIKKIKKPKGATNTK
jgi:hypothetical protein